MVDSVYHGRGRLTWHTGDSYTGTFSYGAMHGRGVYTYRDGSRWGWVLVPRLGTVLVAVND